MVSDCVSLLSRTSCCFLKWSCSSCGKLKTRLLYIQYTIHIYHLHVYGASPCSSGKLFSPTQKVIICLSPLLTLLLLLFLVCSFGPRILKKLSDYSVIHNLSLLFSRNHLCTFSVYHHLFVFFLGSLQFERKKTSQKSWNWSFSLRRMQSECWEYLCCLLFPEQSS